MLQMLNLFWEAIKSRFGGNEESKKMQKNVLKHQFENFTTASNESLDKAYDRFQKLISQLEVHGAPISKEDINQKFLRSLPPSWNQIALIMRNKPDNDEIDIDDLYNSLRVYEDEMKRSSSSTSTSQILIFLSSENTSSTNEVSTTSGDFGVSTARGLSQVSSTPCAYDVACSFFAQPTSSPQLKNEDFQQIDEDDLEELDLRWQVAMLTVRECRSGRNQGRRSYGDNGRSNAPTNESSLQALVAQDGLGGYDWSNDFEVEPCNHETDSENSLSVFDVRSSDEESTPANDMSSKADEYHAVPPPITGNFLTPRADISFAGLDEYAIRNKIIESQTTELNTKTSETAGQTNDENTKKPKSVSESVVSNPKIDRDRVIIEDWNSDDEEEVSEVQTVRPETQTVKTRDDKSGQNSKKQGIGFRKVKACFVCKSTDHLIKHCTFHDKKSQETKLKNMVNTGQREGKPVWDNTKRINHQNFSKYPHLSKTFVPSGVLTRTGLHRPSVSTARPVCTARPSVSTARLFVLRSLKDVSTARPICTARPSVSTARPVYTARPSVSTARPVYATRSIYPRMDNVRPRAHVHLSRGQSIDLVRGSCSSGCDIGKEFKNYAMNVLCVRKGIKREFSVADSQQNSVVERKNRTLIEDARTMLADSLLPIPFWAEAVNTACYETGLIGCIDLIFSPNSMNYIPVSVENQDKDPIEDVAPAAHEKPFESSPKDNDIQDSEDVIDKEGQHQMPED
ncbi:ribonuclease H-like domain-containing protein [Tanacetum coccineum]|uniref:Ribonuclease H-like domain-containing protein n=1 Tax=Tanacetum coccineum TaxID=301880 RepID=A0ABQ4Y0N3_9ASTR